MVFSAAEVDVNAGAQMILTCTFGGTAFRLREAGLELEAYEINRRAAQLAKEAARDVRWSWATSGPLGYLALSSARFPTPTRSVSSPCKPKP